MKEVLDQLDEIANKGYSYVALFTALTIPDICAALESENGEAKAARYKAWFDKWVAEKYTVGAYNTPSLTGATCYAYRCGLLHQGRGMHKDLGYSRIIFVERSNSPVLHNNVMGDALNIDIPLFVESITSSARLWLAEKSGDPIFERNFAHFMKRHVGGLLPYIDGVDVIS